MSQPLPASDRPAPSLDALIACPRCDAVYHVGTAPGINQRATCTRCHHVLIAPRQSAGKRIIAVALSVLFLVVAATITPFLAISTNGLSNRSSILDAALAFNSSGALLLLLSFALAALIVFIPALRAILVIYVLIPLVRNRTPWPGASRAFRLAEHLRPWSMAEVFAVGCAVALIKISALAQVDLGPAFWLFSILVVLVVVQDTLMCRYTVWKRLEG
ncbi:paraquat-inducible protein A [Pseudooceanicola sp. CBS1P-1]|uniref:Paraquat-inducible protein A n=1 Tax=Pseudooceanicola albus TaxID=2692189 RepID=A0A6L7G8J8_9RHOB|nr:MULTISPECIES: paraquat-inducible protein A [Pseudooceanicola]MBT9384175.1 paraquat-inducible protein A [Pseudooceanicola endophyticus]MXN19726.1 paraquat-inducible protein A [Pseudooceanicola albus]